MKQEFFINNRRRIIETIEDNSVLILFAGRAPYKSADEIYEFTPNRNFYYLTGIDRENMILVLEKKAGKENETLYIEKNDPIMARWIGEKMPDSEARSISGIENVKYLEDFKENLGTLFNKFQINNVYLDLERAEWGINPTAAQSFTKELKEKYAYLNIKNIYYAISTMRTIKSKEEIENIVEAGRITTAGIENMMKNIKAGMMEYEIEAYFDYTLKSQGIRDKAFKTIAASGKNATVLHYSQNDSKIEENSLMLFDLGAQYNYYSGDISRTIPVNGKFTERQKQIYNVVLNTNLEITKAAKPGISLMELNELSKKLLAEGCKKLGLIKEDKELSKYYFHSIGHYLGLDTHDVGDRELPLKPGMVITNEPGLYIPEEAIGIRIEDDILITEDGCEVLTKDCIKTVEEIEEFMKNK